MHLFFEPDRAALPVVYSVCHWLAHVPRLPMFREKLTALLDPILLHG